LLTEEEGATREFLELNGHFVFVDLGDLDLEVDVTTFTWIFVKFIAAFTNPLEHKFGFLRGGRELSISLLKRLLNKCEEVLRVVSRVHYSVRHVNVFLLELLQ